jgi:prevent-host-death family protein
MSETSIAEAKTQFARLVYRAERGEAVHITRRGKPVAVLLSETEYARLRQSQAHRNFWDLIVEMRDDPAFVPIDWSLEDVNAWRDRRPTQAFAWPE